MKNTLIQNTQNTKYSPMGGYLTKIQVCQLRSFLLYWITLSNIDKHHVHVCPGPGAHQTGQTLQLLCPGDGGAESPRHSHRQGAARLGLL